VEVPELLTVMHQVALSLRFPMDLEQTLQGITEGVVAATPAIDHASISLTAKDGKITTLAPTDDIAIRADELQYELGEGPCLAAVLEEPVVQVDDIRSDLRWPVYGPRAARDFGIASQLAFQFRAEPHVRGGFNLYSDQPHSISIEDRQLAMLFANLAAAALGWKRQDDSLHKALETRNGIGQAIGILMERYQLDQDRAFAFLVRTSQAGNIKLHRVAAGIVSEVAAKAR
jgi:GAF domain-containing protein